MSIEFQRKEQYNINDLIEIVRLLRLPEGCPWDREQTHRSIRGNLIEEAYEVIEAIESYDTENLKEELGDLLLQVVMHAQMEREENRFAFADVVHDVAYKLVERHPHVFGTVIAENGEQALDSWEAVKRSTKNQETFTQTLESVPKSFPALMRAQKVQKRAAKAGFDWDEMSGALEKVKEEADELLWATEKTAAEELGDLFFSVVNVSRFLGIDSELALQKATDKFISRFAGVEALALERGIDMKTASLEELDKLWDEVKQQRNSR